MHNNGYGAVAKSNRHHTLNVVHNIATSVHQLKFRAYQPQ